MPVSSITSRTAASSGSSSLSICPPGGSHIPSLRWKCKSTLPSHTTNTATVKCLPVCFELIAFQVTPEWGTAGSQTSSTNVHNVRQLMRRPEGGEDLPQVPDDAFRRTDEAPDEEFYRTPRLVTHIDEWAIAAVTQLYREFFPPGGEILDLMSSWISHLPPEVVYRRVIGLGMNEVELRRNERLDAYVDPEPEHEPRTAFRRGGVRRGRDLRLHRLPDQTRGGAARSWSSAEGRCTACRYILESLFSHEGGRGLAPSGRPGPHAARRALPPGGRVTSDNFQSLDRSPRRMFSDPLYAVVGTSTGPHVGAARPNL